MATTVELRPMSLGEVLDQTFTLYRENFLLFAGITALPYLLLLGFNFLILLWGRGTATGSPHSALSGGVIGGFIAGAFGALFIYLILIGVAHAATVSAVGDLYLGRAASVRSSYEQAKGSFGSVIVVMILSFLAVGLGFMLLIIPGIYLACRLGVSVPATVVERNSPVASMQRSMELTREYAWPMFLLILLVFVVEMVVGGLLQLPGTVLTFMALASKQQPSTLVAAYNYIAQFAAQVLVGPIGTISASLMYYNLRVTKEGFDIMHLMNLLNAPRPLADPVTPATR
jgi:hypothetical protein